VSHATAAQTAPQQQDGGVELSRVDPELSRINAELLRINAELSCTNVDLRRSNAELAQFAWMASHDLKDPLRTIASWLDLLNRRCGDQLGDEAKEFVRCASAGAARMRSLIDDLLGFACLGTHTLSLQQVNAEKAVTAALANLHAAICDSRAEIDCAVMPDVLVDALLLTNVFQNLIGNAVKFRGAETPRIWIAVEESAAGWVFSVRDNGIGIPQEHQNRVLAAFERVHSADEYPGNGIGLATVQRIVERHGGRVWLESTFGKGSTFYFLIPSRTPSAGPPGFGSGGSADAAA
jgi:light-regulated signal transduction histidine kinase (bacteriophytochrome)